MTTPLLPSGGPNTVTQKPHCPEKDKYKLPSWAGMPPHGSHLDVVKGDKLVNKLFVDELSHFYFGRNVELCEIPVEHASCSRVHAVLIYHKHLNRFALVDLGSSHGTFISNTRIAPLIPIFMDVGTCFHFGASTRRFIIREKYEAKVEKANTASAAPKQILPEDEEELDHLTEYNTAQNRRIPVIEQSVDDARKKKKNRPKLCFAAEEIIVDLNDPTVGRFQNLVQTALIPRKRRIDDASLDFPSVAKQPRPMIRRLDADAFSRTPADEDEFSSILGIRMNAAPDLDNVDLTAPTALPGSLLGDVEEHHKKYAKEVWPGRKPTRPEDEQQHRPKGVV